jgi:hypothetical protein
MSRDELRVRVPTALRDRIKLIAADLGCSASAWATQALAKAAKNHVPLEDFINQAPARGIGKNRREVESRKLSSYDPELCHPSGYPKQVPIAFWTKHKIVGYEEPSGTPIWGDQCNKPADEVDNFYLMLDDDPERARAFLSRVRVYCGMGEVTDAQWSETTKWASAR